MEHSIDCKENYLGHEMPVCFVVSLTSLLQKLPPNKAPGTDFISAEHLLYASESLCLFLSLMFNMCIVHGFLPNSCVNTTLVLICMDTIKWGTGTRPIHSTFSDSWDIICHAVAYAGNLHGGSWFKVIWWLFVFGVRCL